MCSHKTLLNEYLSATYLVDLYSHLIGELRQWHSDNVIESGECKSDAVSNSDVWMMETTLAAIMSEFDVDKFKSCLQQLIDDVV